MSQKQIGVLCGGSGSSKFASAISSYGDVYPRFVANVGDNYWYHGLLVCPDIDIIMYALSGLLDSTRGWGIKDDTFVGKENLSAGELKEWFSLGDRDFATCLERTDLHRKGWSLSSITRKLSSRMGAMYPVFPATDDPVQTFVRTFEGNLHLQEFWVKNSGNMEALGVEYLGAETARPSEEVLASLDLPVLICPANPVSSILTTLKLNGVVKKLSKTKVVAVSPFVGEKPFSGPAANLMRAIGFEANSFGVAKLYSKFLKIFFLDKGEAREIVSSIRDRGIECVQTDTGIESEADKKSIAGELIGALV